MKESIGLFNLIKFQFGIRPPPHPSLVVRVSVYSWYKVIERRAIVQGLLMHLRYLFFLIINEQYAHAILVGWTYRYATFVSCEYNFRLSSASYNKQLIKFEIE